MENYQNCSVLHCCLQCFDTVCWAAERASGLYKIWGDGGGGHWLLWMEWRPAGWLVCLLLLIFPCTIKSRSSLLPPAHLGGPGKRAVNGCGSDTVLVDPRHRTPLEISGRMSFPDSQLTVSSHSRKLTALTTTTGGLFLIPCLLVVWAPLLPLCWLYDTGNLPDAERRAVKITQTSGHNYSVILIRCSTPF